MREIIKFVEEQKELENYKKALLSLLKNEINTIKLSSNEKKDLLIKINNLRNEKEKNKFLNFKNEKLPKKMELHNQNSNIFINKTIKLLDFLKDKKVL